MTMGTWMRSVHILRFGNSPSVGGFTTTPDEPDVVVELEVRVQDVVLVADVLLVEEVDAGPRWVPGSVLAVLDVPVADVPLPLPLRSLEGLLPGFLPLPETHPPRDRPPSLSSPSPALRSTRFV